MTEVPHDEIPEDAFIESKIELVQYIDKSGHRISAFRAEGRDGSPLPLVEVLGLLRMAEDTAFHIYADQDEGNNG